MKIKIALISIFLVFASSIYGMSMTPQEKLFEGAKWGKINLVEEALKTGANVNMRNKNGNTALILAAANRHNAIVKRLLEVGANVNLQTNHGNTALMVAVINDCTAIVKRLLNSGANVSIINYCNTEIVKQLLNAGADVSIKNDKGKTAIDIAEEKNHREILEILEKHLCYIEQQKKAIKEHLPLIPELQNITAEYLGHPVREKTVEKEEAEVI